MPNTPNTDDLTDEQLKEGAAQISIAQEQIGVTVDMLPVPDGMILVAMARVMGALIRRGTRTLGREVRQQHCDGFAEIIRKIAFDEEETQT